MSLSLLLEKYDVSTDEGLQKALNEIEKEESEVDEALAGVLSRACSLEGKLRTASQAYTKLGEVKNDAQTAADMVDKTAALARDVSAKVRQLDLARSRVAECQRRVHDLIDLQLCSAGVEAAIKAHDYETGAAHVSRFLSMEPGSVAAARARGAPDPRTHMAAAAHTLREHLVRKFGEAAKKEDEASIERLFKLFPQIGRAEEGVDLLAKYLATQTEAAVRRASVITETASVGDEAAIFADALTRVLETGGAMLQRACKAASPCAPGHFARFLTVMQPKICSGARRVYLELVSARRLDLADPRRHMTSPLAAEPALNELSLAHSRIKLYFTFLRRKAEADASAVPEDKKQANMQAVEKIIAECELMRSAQELLAHYLALERYFLEESVNKALKMATPQAGATTSSLVDDVFFITRKVIRRSVLSGSVDGVCAVLNEAASLLEREVAAALRRRARAPPPDPLPLPAPRPHHPHHNPHVALMDASAALAHRINRDQDAQRALFLAHAMEAEAGAEWSERLAQEACTEGAAVCSGPSDVSKLQQCAAGLGGAAAAFRAAHELALAAISAALQPRIRDWAQVLVEPPEEVEEDADADALPAALEVLADNARDALSARAADTLLVSVVTDIAAKAEQRILHHYYDQESGLAVELRARRLAAWSGGGAAGARERCARLTQAAALLALPKPSHAAPNRLPPTLARDILARRTDFKIEEIKRLKL